MTLSSVLAQAQWDDLGLSSREVTQLRSNDGLLYGCTNNGLHRKASDTTDSSWVLLGFAGQRVHDVLAMSPETLIVAREITGTGADTVALLRSTDGGANWSPFQNGLGAGGFAADRKVTALLEPPGAPGTVLAATQNGIVKSIDSGMTWKKVAVGGRFFFLAAGVSTLWGGGEGASFGPIARRSTDGGESWQSTFSGPDDRAVAMAFDPSDPNVAFLGLYGGLHRTSNNGISWTTVPLPLGVASSALGNRHFPPLRLYANGYAPPGGATVFKSDDGGASWTPASFPAAGSSSERTILVRSGPASDTLFLGMGSGVLRYVEVEFVGAGAPERESRLELHAHPNPFRAGTTIVFRLPGASRVSLRMVDSAGREVAVLLEGDLQAGLHYLPWKPRGLPNGAYFCRLRAGREVATRKLLFVR